MTLPSGLSTVTVTGTYKHPNGVPFVGKLTFRPEPVILTSGLYGTLVLGTVEAVLDTNGAFTISLLATNDPDVSPTGWTYRVTERWRDAVGRSYPISLPQAAPTVDIADIAPTAPSAGEYVVVPGPTGPAGPKGDKGDPGDAGTILVQSVNGQQGIVVLAAADVGADASGAATAAQAAATSAAATDATSKVAAHTAASDPHGDRAAATSALTAHAADTTDVHGIANTAALETTAGAQAKADTAEADATAAAASDATSKVAVHAAAADPHGDRAWATGLFATITVVNTLTGTVTTLQGAVTSLGGFVSDALARVAAIEQGTAFLAGLNIDGDAQIANGNLTVTDFAKGYRFRIDGGALDLEGTGSDLIVSVWSGTGFNGTQHAYLRLSADTQNAQLAGPLEIVTSLYGGAVHKLDPTTGVAALGAKNGLANSRLCGRLTTAGAPTADTWTAGDAVQDSTGAWWLCTVGGTPGTWAGGAANGGSQTRTAKVRITDDNLSGLPSAASWTVAQTSASTKLQCSIAAAAGDRIRLSGNFMYVGSHALDWVLLDSGGAIALYAASETSSPLAEGNPAMYPSLSFSKMTSPDMFTVSSGHIDGSGNATIALAHQGTSPCTVYAHTTYPWKLLLENIGPEPA